MIISMGEEQNTLLYQENMKVDVKNIAKKKTYGDQYMKLLMLHFMKKRIFFHKLFFTYVKLIQINLSFYHMKSR